MAERRFPLPAVKVVAVGWYDAGGILPATFEAAAAARLLAEGTDAPAALVLFGADPEPAARDLAAQTGLPVVALRGESLEPACGEDAVRALASLLGEIDPVHVVLAHDTRGGDLAPALAVRLGAACVTAVEEFAVRDGRWTFIRSVCRGRMRMEIAPEAPCTVLTVLPGAPGPGPPDESPGALSAPSGTQPSGAVRLREAAPGPGRIAFCGETPGEETGVDLTEADVIVAAGRGIGREENLEWIRRLAGLFRNAAVGASRPVCDQGWLGYRHQVGLTGRTVAPDLYVACGISGASQHLAGMKGSRCIVAVNRDPAAPIFRVAQYGIVEDLAVFIPLFIEVAAA